MLTRRRVCRYYENRFGTAPAVGDLRVTDADALAHWFCAMNGAGQEVMDELHGLSMQVLEDMCNAVEPGIVSDATRPQTNEAARPHLRVCRREQGAERVRQ